MKKIGLLFCIIFSYQSVVSQPNCQILGDTTCIKACELSIEASKYQGSKYSQDLFDKAIEMCPSFAYAYYEKSVPYLKQGLINEWKTLIDKAVELEPTRYLLNRGCNQIQFFRNYENGLKDLNKLQELLGYFDIGYTNSGEYQISLRRYPSESNLKINDTVPGYSNIEEPGMNSEVPEGKSLDITSARLEIGDKVFGPTAVDDSMEEVVFNARLEKGKTTMTSYFTKSDGEELGAYYVCVESI